MTKTLKKRLWYCLLSSCRLVTFPYEFNGILGACFILLICCKIQFYPLRSDKTHIISQLNDTAYSVGRICLEVKNQRLTTPKKRYIYSIGKLQFKDPVYGS